jgi:hypothetical protein
MEGELNIVVVFLLLLFHIRKVFSNLVDFSSKVVTGIFIIPLSGDSIYRRSFIGQMQFSFNIHGTQLHHSIQVAMTCYRS